MFYNPSVCRNASLRYQQTISGNEGQKNFSGCSFIQEIIQAGSQTALQKAYSKVTSGGKQIKCADNSYFNLADSY
jgi:hypothetical protein